MRHRCETQSSFEVGVGPERRVEFGHLSGMGAACVGHDRATRDPSPTKATVATGGFYSSVPAAGWSRWGELTPSQCRRLWTPSAIHLGRNADPGEGGASPWWNFKEGIDVLVLTRRKHELTVICLPDGRTIEVMIVDVDGAKVRVGFEAPQDIGIYRSELLPPPPAESTR